MTHSKAYGILLGTGKTDHKETRMTTENVAPKPETKHATAEWALVLEAASILTEVESVLGRTKGVALQAVRVARAIKMLKHALRRASGEEA